jgi:hypothetical protein
MHYIDSRGIAACCRTPKYQVSLDQWPSHPELIKLQQTLLAGDTPQICQGCDRDEQAYGTSLRIDSNRDCQQASVESLLPRLILLISEPTVIFWQVTNAAAVIQAFRHGISQELNRYPKLDLPYFVTATG